MGGRERGAGEGFDNDYDDDSKLIAENKGRDVCMKT